MKPARLELYFGSPDNDPYGTYLYLELAIPGIGGLGIRTSERLDEEGGADILEEFHRSLNLAALVKKSLPVKLSIDWEGIKTECVELGISDEAIEEILKTIRMFQKEQKGEL